MTYNVLGEYIKITTKEINDYMKLIFENKYIKRISDKYIEAYLNVRFYNFYPKDDNLTFRKNFLNVIKLAEQNIAQENPKDIKLIENMGLFYYYILYFDKISYRKDINENIEKLYKLRAKILKKYDEDFKDKFYSTYEKYLKIKEDFINKFEDENFYLKITDYEGISNTHKVMLKYNIKFPMIYSNIAIQKVFDTGIILEDKLNVEYYLVAADVIQDILRGHFKRQYVVEFAPTILLKPKKMKSILNIINNPAAQDKISLKVKYEDFITYKEQIYELMRQGFRFAIIVDDTMDSSYSTLSKLNVFSYIIINKKLKNYDEIMENRVILKNIIEI